LVHSPSPGNREDGQCDLYEMAPLRKKDVVLAAGESGVNAIEFVNAVEEKQVAPLASTPVTLRFLLSLYKENGAFPVSHRDLYLEGCTRLCQEQSKSRSTPHTRPRVKNSLRFLIAGRIAVCSIFSNRAFIYTGNSSTETRDTDILIDDLIGAPIRDGSQELHPSRDDVLEVLDSSLFSSGGADRVVWAHKTYAEFLAAFHLGREKTPLKNKMAFLGANEHAGKIAPQLHDAAAWMAER